MGGEEGDGVVQGVSTESAREGGQEKCARE